MGFHNVKLGNIHECWIENGYVHEQCPFSGKVYKYPTRLNVTIPKQCNLYYAKDIAFYLKHNGEVYIGRHDGSISIYRESDMLLTGLNNWDAPVGIPTCIIGFHRCGRGLREVLLDLRDKQTIYVDYHDIEGFLDRPFLGNIESIFSSSVFDNIGSWSVVTGGGEVIGVSVWNIQDSVWSGNCTIFV